MIMCFMNQDRQCDNECSLYDSSGFKHSCAIARFFLKGEEMFSKIKSGLEYVEYINSNLKKINNTLETISVRLDKVLKTKEE